MDRRIKERHHLQLVCRFGETRVLCAPREGLTENLSRGGILMHWLEAVPLPRPGDTLNVEVDLPGGADLGPRTLRCATTVVRVDRGKTSIPRVGLRIDKIRFTRPGSKRLFNLATMKLSSDKVN